MDKDGFLIKSEVKQSSIPGAGRGRFFSQSCKSGDIIRIQDVNSDLKVYKNIVDIENENNNLVMNFHTVGAKIPTLRRTIYT